MNDYKYLRSLGRLLVEQYPNPMKVLQRYTDAVKVEILSKGKTQPPSKELEEQ